MDPESLERENERGIDMLSERIGLLKQVLSGGSQLYVRIEAVVQQRHGDAAQLWISFT